MVLLSRQENIFMVFTVFTITIAITVFTFSIDALYEHDSHLFQFGPFKQFLFLGITIDTWFKYILLIIFLVLLEFLDILQEEFLDPFIHMIYDANASENREQLSEYTWWDLYFINHLALASDGLRQILRIIIVTIQIPLAILIWLLKEVIRIPFVRSVTNNWFKVNDRWVELGKPPKRRSRKRFARK